MNQDLRVLYVETDPADLRAADFYLAGFARKGFTVKTLSSAEGSTLTLNESWDVILVHSDKADVAKTDLLEHVRRRLVGIPVIDLGQTQNDLITGGAETAIEDLLPRIQVSSVAVLRSVKHLLERRRLEKQVEALREQVTAVSHTDAASGLWNHSYVIERINEEFLSWQRYRFPLTICLFDILNFEQVNDTYGYEVADDVVRACGKMIAETKRNTDFAGRSGNDGFCLVFPKTPMASALIGVERIRDAVRRTLFHGKATENFTVEASFGMVQLGEDHKTVADFIHQGRQALKRAKKQGAGRIEICSSSLTDADALPSVFIADGQSSNIELCRSALEGSGIRASSARSLREARRTIEAEAFDLYLIGLDLPDGDGRELARSIASRQPGRPIVLLSDDSEMPLSEAKSLGAARVLKKPFAAETIAGLARTLVASAPREALSQIA